MPCNFQNIKKGQLGETYNIGGNTEISNIKLVKDICKILDKKYNKKKTRIQISLNMFLIGLVMTEDMLLTQKIQKNLGWKPSYSFSKGLKVTIEWYLNNIEWTNIVKKDYKKWIKKLFKKNLKMK